MRFVAAEAGFFPPGPFTLFAAMLANIDVDPTTGELPDKEELWKYRVCLETGNELENI